MKTSRTPVVFIHGLWLHADSWAPWMELFRSGGYEPINPGWPGVTKSVEETRRQGDAIANRGIAEATEHFAQIIRSLEAKPIVIGHSFGGLIAEKLLGMGIASAAVAIAPAQIRGVLPVPWVQLRTVLPVLANPINLTRAVSQTQEQFHRGFANAVSRDESNALHAAYAIPAPGRPLFELVFANFNPGTAAKVDVNNPRRGPLLIIGGGKDATVPEVVTRAAHRLYRKAPTVNDYKVFGDRGHSMVMDHGWKEVAEASLQWLGSKGVRAGSPMSEVHSPEVARGAKA